METKPYGDVEQDDFLNGAAEIDTLYEPHELLDKIHETENKGGRERTVKWGPRTIDLDILLYDHQILTDKDLMIPHPEMHKRMFVLKPLESIAPWAEHPVFKETVSVLASKIHSE